MIPKARSKSKKIGTNNSKQIFKLISLNELDRYENAFGGSGKLRDLGTS